ncbi:RNA-binding domain-containing [Ceratobasidium sp. AG-Ba]|nr:RNA-binding domain-containing [Ceratobasidium sp. AG-Ba]
MSVHGDDDLYADLYGNDDYAAAEDEILGTKSTSADKSDVAPTETTQPSTTSEPKADKNDMPTQVPTAIAPKPVEYAPEPRAVAQPPPQVGSSIATYTSDEGTTLPPTGYNNGYGSLPHSMRPYDPEAEKQPSYAKPSSNEYGEGTSEGSPTEGYNNQSGDGNFQQKQGGYANGAVYESSNQGGFQRGAFNNFGGAAQAGNRRFDSVRPSEMKDEG